MKNQPQYRDKILDATAEQPDGAPPSSVDFRSQHRLDARAHPAGGTASGRGFSVCWQNGPLIDPDTGERRPPNGAFVETLLGVVLDRMHFYQDTKFSCDSNQRIIEHLEAALREMQARTRDRQARGVEGTYTA